MWESDRKSSSLVEGDGEKLRDGLTYLTGQRKAVCAKCHSTLQAA